MSHHLIPALEVIYVGPCGTSFLRRHSTRFNDIQRILRKGSKRFTKFCEVLQGSARLRGSHAPCAKGSTYWTKVQWSPTNQEKSDTSLSKSYVQRELLNLAAMGCDMDVRTTRIAWWATKWLRYTAIFTSQPKIPVICIPNCKIMQNRWIPSAVYLRVKTPDGAEQTTNLWIAMQATMFCCLRPT